MFVHVMYHVVQVTVNLFSPNNSLNGISDEVPTT